ATCYKIPECKTTIYGSGYSGDRNSEFSPCIRIASSSKSRVNRQQQIGKVAYTNIRRSYVGTVVCFIHPYFQPVREGNGRNSAGPELQHITILKINSRGEQPIADGIVTSYVVEVCRYIRIRGTALCSEYSCVTLEPVGKSSRG